MLEMVAIVKGRVQGVGFRATAKAYADGLKLTGFASNLSDGTVKICAQGLKEDLQTFIASLKKEFGSYIQEIEISYRDAQETFPAFTIY